MGDSKILQRCRLGGEDLPADEAFFHFRSDTQKLETACRTHLAARNREYAKKRAQEDPERHRAKSRYNRQQLRRLILREYGHMCQCCGEDEEMFLALDHINNDGSAERKRLTGVSRPSTQFYRQVRDQGFPKDKYQLLCNNCNWAKHVYGLCAHQGGVVPDYVWAGSRERIDHAYGRVCRCCQEFKSANFFYQYQNGRLMSRCIDCCKSVTRRNDLES